jgi:drug/metabolite transporter (DMT)-like permease
VTRRRAELALVFNTLIWGSTFVVVKEALTGITPLLFMALRFGLATLVLLAMFRGMWSNPREARAAVRGFRLPDLWAAAHLGAQIGVHYGTFHGIGTFIRGARL